MDVQHVRVGLENSAHEVLSIVMRDYIRWSDVDVYPAEFEGSPKSIR